jgi:4-aminobutyrate aminotransferase
MNKSNEFLSTETETIARTGIIRYYPMVVSKGQGARLWDVDGREYIDFSSGGCVANVGYCHPRIVRAISEQASRLTHSCFTVCSNDRTPVLAEKLIELLPGNYEKKVWFGLSGSDANDWIYKILPKATGRQKLVSFIGNYQGQTMGAAALSGLLPQKRFLSISNVVHIPYPYCYRCPLGHNQDNCGQECFSFFSSYLVGSICAPDEIAAVVFEPIQGDSGIIIPPSQYIQKLLAFCRDNKILLVVDEVLSGIGRTGTWWSCQQQGIEPDLVVIGKALASGVPISAVAGRKDLLDVMTASHHVTCGGNVLASAAGLETLAIIEEENLLANAKAMGELILKRLEQVRTSHRIVGEVRGLGLLIGIEIQDGEDPSNKMAHKIVYACWQRGLLLYYLGLFGNVLIIVPPLVINQNLVEEGLEILDQAIGLVEQGKISDEDIQAFAAW